MYMRQMIDVYASLIHAQNTPIDFESGQQNKTENICFCRQRLFTQIECNSHSRSSSYHILCVQKINKESNKTTLL